MFIFAWIMSFLKVYFFGLIVYYLFFDPAWFGETAAAVINGFFGALGDV